MDKHRASLLVLLDNLAGRRLRAQARLDAIDRSVALPWDTTPAQDAEYVAACDEVNRVDAMLGRASGFVRALSDRESPLRRAMAV